MTAILFLLYLAVCAAAVIGIASRLRRREAVTVSAGLLVWLLYAGLVARSGLLTAAAGRPPGILLLVVPAIVFVIFVARSRGAGRVALALPVGLLVGAQAFRIGVEIFLHRLAAEGLAPKMLTFEGANVDLWIGLSAPLAAWLAGRGSRGARLALYWNALGLLSLANVVVRAFLTAPGPANLLHTEVPNLVVSTFPYSFIPGFFAPLAVVLHVLAIRNLAGTGRAARPIDTEARAHGERLS
jgi:hypothetical protein